MSNIVDSERNSRKLLSHGSFKIGGKRVQIFFSLPYTSNNVSYNDPMGRLFGAHNDFCKDLVILSHSHYT